MKKPNKLLSVLTAGLTFAGLAVGGGGMQTAAASPHTSQASATSGATLTLDNEIGGTWTCGFNPFNTGNIGNGITFGEIYEELTYVNTLKSGATTPWLATGYAWSNGNKTLTFTIRQGVKWSDGQPFSAKDVLFTFDLLKKFPALDLTSVWSVLSSVSLKGANQVVFQFKTEAVPYFYYIADQVPIVPEHIWSKISNPVTYLDANPVGTGPYEMRNCTPQNITYQRNPGYWQKGKPAFQTVYYPAFTSNTPANLQLATGQAQWGSQFIPNIKGFYTSKNPNYHYWFPPVANVSIFVNLKNPVLQNLAVRQAIAYAINRPLVSKIGEYGYEPPSNQTGIVTPTFSSWLNKSLANKYNYSYNPAKAKSLLEHAGFKMVGGVMQKGSQKLSFTFLNNGGFSDWVAAGSVIQQDLKAVGIKVTPENLSATTYQTKLYTGSYELGYGSETGGPGPYYELRQWLYSANTAPVGKVASTNYERYSSPATDALINSYAATTSTAAQHNIISQLEKVMLSDVPVVPVTESVAWYQYDTGKVGGWVTPSNPYALPAIYNYPDMGVVLTHLYPKG
jgi:peptide/nickel transport system substrate-binding protein